MAKKQEYIVRQMAEIWYQTTVWAESKDEALAIASNGNSRLDWEQLLDSTEFTDNWEVEG